MVSLETVKVEKLGAKTKSKLERDAASEPD